MVLSYFDEPPCFPTLNLCTVCGGVLIFLERILAICASFRPLALIFCNASCSSLNRFIHFSLALAFGIRLGACCGCVTGLIKACVGLVVGSIGFCIAGVWTGLNGVGAGATVHILGAVGVCSIEKSNNLGLNGV